MFIDLEYLLVLLWFAFVLGLLVAVTPRGLADLRAEEGHFAAFRRSGPSRG